MTTKKLYDIIIWGASGFTGRLVADYLFHNYRDKELSWALAGRNQAKLEEIRIGLGDQAGTVPIVIADSNDEASLKDMVDQTKVIISTVGPFAWHGSLLVKVCAEAGVSYCDLTGEPQWIRKMIDANEAAARNTGARIVHCCGFDSIPSDMGVYFLQQQAIEKFKEPLSTIQFTLLKAKGGFSGGTVHSLANVLEEAQKDSSIRRLVASPYCLTPRPIKQGPKQPNLKVPRKDRHSKQWLMPFVMAGINTKVVHRTNALNGFSYGENFLYEEVQAAGEGIKGRLTAFSVSAVLAQLMLGLQYKISRNLLKRFVFPNTGEGPDIDPDNPGFYKVEITGETKNGEKLQAVVKGDADPGYGSTCKMLAESAICLAKDFDKNLPGGFWTPSTAMGDHLLNRLRENAGLTFELKN